MFSNGRAFLFESESLAALEPGEAGAASRERESHLTSLPARRREEALRQLHHTPHTRLPKAGP